MMKVFYVAAILSLLLPQLLRAGEPVCDPLTTPSPQPSQPEDECDVTDGRVQLDPPASDRARIVFIDGLGVPLVAKPCTASLYNQTTFITAAHCLRDVAQGEEFAIVQFDVPDSEPNGDLNHPPAKDQFCMDVSSVTLVEGSTGSAPEVALFTVDDNENDDSPFEEQRAHVFIDNATPSQYEAIDIVGHSHVHNSKINATQQIRFSSVDDPQNPSTGWLEFEAKIENGDSGSAVISQASEEVVGIVAGAGLDCEPAWASPITHSLIRDAMCGASRSGSPVPCADITSFAQSCVKAAPSRWLLTATLTLAGDHNGSKVKFEVQKVEIPPAGPTQYIRTVTGNQAILQTQVHAVGNYNVRLLSPRCQDCDPCGDPNLCGDCSASSGECVTCQCSTCPDPNESCESYCGPCGAVGPIAEEIVVTCIDSG